MEHGENVGDGASGVVIVASDREPRRMQRPSPVKLAFGHWCDTWSSGEEGGKKRRGGVQDSEMRGAKSKSRSGTFV